MTGPQGLSLAGLYFLSQITVVAADDNAGVIAASVVAGCLVLIAFAGVTIYCFYKRKGFSTEKRTKKSKHEYIANGGPPHKHRTHHRHHHHHHYNNSKHQANGVPHIPIQPVVRQYTTYHGPPPGYYPAPPPPPHMNPGTMSGPPPLVVVPTSHGTVTMRPDPRPVVHKKKRDNRFHDDNRDRHKRSRSQPPPSEFLIEHSPDGIPVIRPVIYVDDDKDRHRSRSRHKSRDRSPSGAQVTEIKLSDTERITNTVQEVEIHQTERSRSPSKSPARTPPSRRSPERSRASSVTEAVNALRMSVKQHGSKDIATDTESELDTSRPFSPQEQRAPDPVAGDVLFLPAGAQQPSLRESHKPAADRTEQVYSYTKLIKSNREEQTTEEYESNKRDSRYPLRSSTVDPAPHRSSVTDPAPLRSSVADHGTPKMEQRPVQANYLGTRDQEPKAYETEHTVQSPGYMYVPDIRTSMSDRITALVEDGDKTRFTHYNVGAVTLGEESGEDEGDGMQVKRPATPPKDFSGIYSRPFRPSSPPNDIPLISPTESTEIPRLDLQSSSATPRVMSYRPASPPRDFPITPQSSILRPRPSTPPFDADTHRETQRESLISNRSEAVNPATGEPGSFQARKRLIEAHLQSVVQTDTEKGNTNSKILRKTPENIPRSEPSNTSVSPLRSTIVVQPGVIPPAPPPPPIRK